MILQSILLSIVSALLGALFALTFENWNKRRKQIQTVQFEIYMKLLEFKGMHFWAVSRELRGEEPDPSTLHKQADIGWQIADLLRTADSLSEAEDVVRVLFGLTFDTEQDRGDFLNDLIGRIGDRVNPKYNMIVRQIDEENQRILHTDVTEYMKRLHKLSGR